MLARSPALALLPGLVLACSFRRQPPTGASGDVIYRLQNCANCHGEEREGTHLGPPLAGLGERWSVELLAEYLADPSVMVARDARLAALDVQFGASDMGRYDNLDLAQRRTLAAWLLSSGGVP